MSSDYEKVEKIYFFIGKAYEETGAAYFLISFSYEQTAAAYEEKEKMDFFLPQNMRRFSAADQQIIQLAVQRKAAIETDQLDLADNCCGNDESVRRVFVMIRKLARTLRHCPADRQHLHVRATQSFLQPFIAKAV